MSNSLFSGNAYITEQKKKAKEAIVHLLHQKRESIIATLFFSAGTTQHFKPMVRFLDRLRLHEANEYVYRIIKESIVEPDIIKAFSHWQIIPIQALAVVRLYPCFLKKNHAQHN